MATQPPKFTLIVWPLDKVILITLQWLSGMLTK
jgi:hypothetical protein